MRGRYARYVHVYTRVCPSRCQQILKARRPVGPLDAKQPSPLSPIPWLGRAGIKIVIVPYTMVNTFTIALDGENHQLSDLLPS